MTSAVPSDAAKVNIRRRPGRRGVLSALILLVAPVSLGAAARSATAAEARAELVMVDEPGCPYCARWEAEIGIGYAKSEEGRYAPLRRIRKGHADLASFAPVTHTPTFIVVHQGKEVGRIVGYPGADFFWSLLDGVLLKAGYRPDVTN